MSLPAPNLDDRNFKDLMSSSLKILENRSLPWTDLSPSDPGITLLELFAHISETLLYRLNRVPQKAYVEFLNLIGVKIKSASASRVSLSFTREEDVLGAIEIPRSTRVIAKDSDGDGGEVVFITTKNAVLKEGEKRIEVSALHCQEVAGELLGMGSGAPSQVFTLTKAPVIAPSGDHLDLLIASELQEKSTLRTRDRVLKYGNKRYIVWTEVDSFAGYGPEDFVYMSDRFSGQIIFAPELRKQSGDSEFRSRMGASPESGLEIRAWYRYGGGEKGNVGRETLNEAGLTGLSVTNKKRSTGGINAETLEEALERGPLELHSLRRAVTAQDFESIAMHESRMIARAKAYTKSELWAFAEAGTVDVVLVPFVEKVLRDQGIVTQEYMSSLESGEVLQRIQTVLDERKPMGTSVQVRWAKYKAVSVKATLLVSEESRKEDVINSVTTRLYSEINPLPTRGNNRKGWDYGEALHASSIYDICLSDPSVKVVKDVILKVDHVPDVDVTSLSRSRFYPNSLFATSGQALYRSVDQGLGWEKVFDSSPMITRSVHCDPMSAGLLVLVSESRQKSGRILSKLSFSKDDGETWLDWSPSFDFEINDCSWLDRSGQKYLILASATGLFELPLREGAVPNLLAVDAENQNLGFYAVTGFRDSDGLTHMAAAAKDRKGIYYLTLGGESTQFVKMGLEGADIRVLKSQSDGTRRFLWAGTATAGDQPGDACFRKEIRRGGQDPLGWKPFKSGWTGGSVHDIVFMGRIAVAASHKAGVLILDTGKQRPKWTVPDVGSGLPNRSRKWFHPVRAVALSQNQESIFAGGDRGVFASQDKGMTYESVSRNHFTEKVSLPPSWLFCSGSHEIDVVFEL